MEVSEKTLCRKNTIPSKNEKNTTTIQQEGVHSGTDINSIEKTQVNKKGRRHPFSSFPKGWYIIATSSDIKPKQIKVFHYFDQDIVIFRGSNGELACVEPYCPHLGAHLGSGIVKDNNIVCPFHNWEFNTKGKCKHIPYADANRIPANSKLTLWPLREKDGLILIYYNVSGKQPEDDEPFPVPKEFSLSHWGRAISTTPLKARTHVQELAENSFDLGHFSAVHGMGAPIVSIDEIQKNSLLFSHEMNYTQGGIKLKYRIKMEQVGPNTSISRVEWGRVRLILMVTNTPIDEEHIEIRTVVAIKNPSNRLLREIFARYNLWYTKKELKKDIPIWESKRYLNKPMLCHADGPIHILRNWIKQFY